MYLVSSENIHCREWQNQQMFPIKEMFVIEEKELDNGLVKEKIYEKAEKIGKLTDTTSLWNEKMCRDEKKSKLLTQKLASFRKTISTRTFTTRFFLRPFCKIKQIENEKIKFSFRFHIKFLFLFLVEDSPKKERNDENEDRRRRIIQLS